MQLQYRIIIECNKETTPVTIAGFLAAEQTESLLCKHLSNLCLQSDGSFLCTQILITNLMLQWTDSFSMNATQTLKNGGCKNDQHIEAVCLYKTFNGSEKLINKINF
jgi:hypothetical protein